MILKHCNFGASFVICAVGSLNVGRGLTHSQGKESMTMKFRGLAVSASVLGALAAATVVAPSASATSDGCSAEALAGTVSSVTGSAHQYLDAHPDANDVVTAAYGQPQPVAAANLRGYFTAHPQEYVELRGILAPIGDKQRQCNVSLLSPVLSSAYDQFMAG
jgi:hemophore-related protein